MGQAASPAMAVREPPAATAVPRQLHEAALDPHRSATDASRMHAVARHGVSGAAGSYPYADRIREAFGRYAPAGLRAHFGPAAREAGAALSAEAFVWNGEAAFAERPSLHTAAHEAAHLVDQAAGVELHHGVGVRGDARERLADRVADTVAAGRSAEPVFAAALGSEVSSGGGAPALQMLNKITNHDGPPKDTPWKEIQDQLSVKPGVIQKNLKIMSPNRFGKMVDTLGNSCARANWVEAKIARGRPSGLRTADATQSAYGALGSFMSYVTDTDTPAKMEFEGGHLISDELVGGGGYDQWNFAPQRGHINAPIYRKIEELADHGIELKDRTLLTAKPKATMRAEVKYAPGKVTIDKDDVMLRLGITPADLTAATTRTTVDLTHRVPWLWTAKIDSGHDDYVFKEERTVDPGGIPDALARSGAAFGFLPTESDVEAYEPKTLTHVDTNFWSMDSMKHAVTGQPGVFGTGSGGDRKRIHTFKAVQSVPTGADATIGSATVVQPAPKPLPSLALTRSYSFSEFGQGGLSDPQAWNEAQKTGEDLQAKEPALTGFTPNTVAAAIARLQYIKLIHKNPKRGKKRSREEHLTSVMDDPRTPKKSKKETAIVLDALTKNIKNTTSSGPTWP